MSYSRHIHGLLVVGLTSFCFTWNANAAIVLEEDFEGIDISGGPANLTNSNSIFTSNVSGGTFQVINNNPPPLPTGGTNNFTGTQYLRYVDEAASPVLRAPVALSGGFVLSFDYFEPNETSGTQTALRVLLSNGVSGTSSGANGVRAVELNLNVGNSVATGTITSIGTAANSTVNPFVSYNANQLVHIDVVGNLAPGVAAYGGGASPFPSGTVAQFQYDLYVNGVLAIEAAGFRNPHASITEFALVSISTTASVQTAYIDNISIDNILPIPEPGSFMLFCIGIAGCGIHRRRRNS